MIAEFNRRIIINRYEFQQNSYGGNIAAPLSTWNLWANVETTAGNKSLDQQQINYSKSFQIKVRAEKSRPIITTDEIVYEGNTLIIQSITKEAEGRVNFLNIAAYTTNEGAAEYIPPATTGNTVYWGWSLTPFTAANVEAFIYQKQADFAPTANINADYTAASIGHYLVLKYPVTFSEKLRWYNATAAANYGDIPDQVFEDTVTIGQWNYVFTRLVPALKDKDKVIIYG